MNAGIAEIEVIVATAGNVGNEVTAGTATSVEATSGAMDAREMDAPVKRRTA